MGDLMDKSFEELKQHWYKQLSDNGFVDAEDVTHPDSPLKTWHSFKWRNTPDNKSSVTRDYYIKAMALVDTYQFDNPTHKTIWELHCEGLSKRKIEVKIKDFTLTYKREQIGNIINIIAGSIK